MLQGPQGSPAVSPPFTPSPQPSSCCLPADLPGFTRSVYHRDHALIAPESRVWAGLPGW